MLHYISLYTTLFTTTLRYAMLHYTTARYATLHYAMLHYITPHQPTLHYSPGLGVPAKAAEVAMVATATGAAAMPFEPAMCLELVGDTGAGENLASLEALRRQTLKPL